MPRLFSLRQQSLGAEQRHPKNVESSPQEQLAQLLAQAPAFENRSLSYYSPNDGSHIYSTVSASDMEMQIPETNAWTMATWFLVCHPLRQGNGRAMRDFLKQQGVQMPEKTYKTYDEREPGAMILTNERAHIDPLFAQIHRKQIFDWLNQNWAHHQQAEGRRTNYELTPQMLPEFKQKLEENPLEFPELWEQIRESAEQVKPHLDKLKEIQAQNPNREVPGKIQNGQIEVLEPSEAGAISVEGQTFEQERALAEEGEITFHTHPDKEGDDRESATDIVATYVRLHEVLVTGEKVFLLVADQKLPIDEIKQISEDAWKEAERKQDFGGEDAYWLWGDIIRSQLPITRLEI